MTMEVVKGRDDKILRTVSAPVNGSVTAELRHFAMDMIKTMNAENGVGIAAPQVGRNIRMVICKFNPGEANEVIVPMINPEMVHMGSETVKGEEGCLSLPGLWGKVDRVTQLIVRFKNLKGQEQTLELNDFNARIMQHEMDHLNATLFIDRAEDVEERTKSKKSK